MQVASDLSCFFRVYFKMSFGPAQRDHQQMDKIWLGFDPLTALPSNRFTSQDLVVRFGSDQTCIIMQIWYIWLVGRPGSGTHPSSPSWQILGTCRFCAKSESVGMHLTCHLATTGLFLANRTSAWATQSCFNDHGIKSRDRWKWVSYRRFRNVIIETFGMIDRWFASGDQRSMVFLLQW